MFLQEHCGNVRNRRAQVAESTRPIFSATPLQRLTLCKNPLLSWTLHDYESGLDFALTRATCTGQRKKNTEGQTARRYVRHLAVSPRLENTQHNQSKVISSYL